MSSSLTLVLFFIFSALLFALGVAFFFILRAQRKKLEGIFYQSEEGPLFFKVEGKRGPWVILIHGLGASGYCWRNVEVELKPYFRLVTLDLWGFGNSSKNLNRPMTLDRQVELIRDLLDSLKIKKCHIVGHSMGAEIALWLKHEDSRVLTTICITPATHPHLVSQLFTRFSWIANWTPLILTKNSIRRMLVTLLKEPSYITEEMVEAYYRPYSDYRAHLTFAAALNIIRDRRVFDRLPQFKGEIFVLWGAKDTVIPSRIRKEIMDRLRQARHFTHPWSGHLPMEDDHHWVAKQIIHHLKSEID